MIRRYTPVPNWRVLMVREGELWVGITRAPWLVSQGYTRLQALNQLRQLASQQHWFFGPRNRASGSWEAPADYPWHTGYSRLWTGDDGTKDRPFLVRRGKRVKS